MPDDSYRLLELMDLMQAPHEILMGFFNYMERRSCPKCKGIGKMAVPRSVEPPAFLAAIGITRATEFMWEPCAWCQERGFFYFCPMN